MVKWMVYGKVSIGFTGDKKFINALIKNGRFTYGNPADYGYKVYKLPTP
jgi:hypothetical protein